MEFNYTGKEKYGDTKSTSDFKQKYTEWINRPKWKRQYLRYKAKPSSLIIPIILAIIIIYFAIKWSDDGTLDKFGDKLSEIKQNITSDFKEAGSEIAEKVETKMVEIEISNEQSAKEECQEALERVNELRKSEGTYSIKWSDKIYDIALERAKDMYERDYFSHYTPDGKDISDYFGNVGVSENIGKDYYSCNEAVEGWIGSPGHHKNLLFGSSGAIAKNHGIYVYVSVG